MTVASSRPLGSTPAPNRDDEADDDEVEIKGKIISLAPLTVQSATRSVTCVVPAGKSLAGFASGDFVEITCDLKAGVWVLRKLEHEDNDDDGADRDEDDDDDRSGHGGGGDDDDNSGPGGGDDHD